MSGTENIVKPIAGDVLDLRKELIDDILLNGLLSSSFLSIYAYVYRLLLSTLVIEACYCRGEWSVPTQKCSDC